MRPYSLAGPLLAAAAGRPGEVLTGRPPEGPRRFPALGPTLSGRVSGSQTDARLRRNGDPEQAASEVRFRHDRCHSHSAGDLPRNHFTTFLDGFVQLSRMPRRARPN